jgi:hypothetical protein
MKKTSNNEKLINRIQLPVAELGILSENGGATLKLRLSEVVASKAFLKSYSQNFIV